MKNILKKMFKKSTTKLDNNDLFSIIYENNELLLLDGNVDICMNDYVEIQKILKDKNNICKNLYFDFDNKKIKLHTNDECFLNDEFNSDLGGHIGVIFINKQKIREKMNIKRVNQDIINTIKENMSNYISNTNCK